MEELIKKDLYRKGNLITYQLAILFNHIPERTILIGNAAWLIMTLKKLVSQFAPATAKFDSRFVSQSRIDLIAARGLINAQMYRVI